MVNSILNICGTNKLFSQWLHHFASRGQCVRVSISPGPHPTPLVECLSYENHPSGCERVSQGGFDLRFLNGQRCTPACAPWPFTHSLCGAGTLLDSASQSVAHCLHTRAHTSSITITKDHIRNANSQAHPQIA